MATQTEQIEDVEVLYFTLGDLVVLALKHLQQDGLAPVTKLGIEVLGDGFYEVADGINQAEANEVNQAGTEHTEKQEDLLDKVLFKINAVKATDPRAVIYEIGTEEL